MTTASQSNNATPQRLHLPPRIIPRMPFSSPMGEEILSPTSPTSSKSPPQHRLREQRHWDGQGNTRQKSKKCDVQKALKGDGQPMQENGQNRPRWPGLNVVTNLPKPSKPEPGLGLKEPEDVNGIGRMNVGGASSLGHQRSGKSLKSSASKGRLDELKRAVSKTSTLSPSDRAVLIGISFSPEELAEHSTSPEAGIAETEGLNEQHARDRPSNTPTIVVTPAKGKAPWSTSPEEPVHPHRRKPPSSVYSQAPKNDSWIIDSAMVPPIPPLPPDAQRHHPHYNMYNDRRGKESPSRIMSSITVFDEEESPAIGAGGRTLSGESQIRILKRSSTDSIATRHRSQGWWNHIVSPFFPRSPMTFKDPSFPPPKPVLSIPSPHRAVTVGNERARPRSRRRSSLPTPKSQSLKSSHTSWTDSSVLAENEKDGSEVEGPPRRETLIIDKPREAARPDSSVVPAKFEGFGEASEYYEACWHDMHSPTPYFECQSHTCLPPRLGPSGTLQDRDPSSTQVIEADASTQEMATPPNLESPHSLAIHQAPTNRFSAAFHEAIGSSSKQRPESEATVIEDLDTTPDVQEAHAAPVVRAPEPITATQPSITDSEPEHTMGVQESPQALPVALRGPPAYSPPRQERPPKRFVAVLPPDEPQHGYEQPISPAPPIPGPRRQTPRDAILLTEVSKDKNSVRLGPNKYTTNNFHQAHETRGSSEKTTLADLYPPPRDESKVKRTWETRENDELASRGQRSRGFAKRRNCFGRDKPMEKKKKRMLVILAVGLVLLIICILVLAMTLTRKGKKIPVQTQWLNMTGYPPIPTGVSTIVQPNAVEEQSGCVHPSTMWSCALPKEQQQSIEPNAPDQPNLRFEIMFQNGTNATSGSTSATNKRSYGHIALSVYARSLIRDRILRIRDSLHSPSPSAPDQEDQTFIGNTTDGNAAPFEGEYTPFFMSFEASTKLPSSRLLKRQSTNADNTTDPFPDVTTAIPPPDTNPDGTAAPAELLPYPSAQPLRLFNRGQSDEHYGFYNYFDRSIFLISTAPLNASSNDTSPVPDDDDGGVDENAASVLCTWAQTRFLVQIWTKKGDSLIQGSSNDASQSAQTTTAQNSTNVSSSSANDFIRPGSFPYPVTVTIDRHGGDIKSKMIYCYGMDDREHIISSKKKLQLEDRGFGGRLVNPALGPFGDVNVTTAQGGPGGIDGGSGGCACKWQNWR
ncbi:hypothetical protein MMC28_009058 [Mycoblastus sanguinarius]|nr:hypothetical protein [Mycoblastus sanguinarius]